MAAADIETSPTLGFSVKSPRFKTLGIHPNSLSRVQWQSLPNVGPGSYDLQQYGDFSKKNVEKRAQGPNWQQSLYTERMAKIPHSSYKETHEKEQEKKTNVAPGRYEFVDFLTEFDKRPQCVRGALEQLTPRFSKDEPERAPPPGSYGIADEKFIEAHWKRGSKVPSFEWRQGSRSLPLEGSKIGPGTYSFKSSVEELLNKRVGDKGPYQVFSIERSAPIKTGHYALIDHWDLSPDFPSKDFPDSMSLARQLEKNKNGTFSKLTRFPKRATDRTTIEFPGLQPKNVDFPAPGHYESVRQWERGDFHATNIPFNSSSGRSDKMTFATPASLHAVGIGRYNLTGPVRDETNADRRKRPKRRNIGFASTTDRFGNVEVNTILNERIQPQHLRTDQRAQLFLTGHV